jgi:hypothetical protein
LLKRPIVVSSGMISWSVHAGKHSLHHALELDLNELPQDSALGAFENQRSSATRDHQVTHFPPAKPSRRET